MANQSPSDVLLMGSLNVNGICEKWFVLTLPKGFSPLPTPFPPKVWGFDRGAPLEPQQDSPPSGRQWCFTQTEDFLPNIMRFTYLIYVAKHVDLIYLANPMVIPWFGPLMGASSMFKAKAEFVTRVVIPSFHIFHGNAWCSHLCVASIPNWCLSSRDLHYIWWCRHIPMIIW